MFILIQVEIELLLYTHRDYFTIILLNKMNYVSAQPMLLCVIVQHNTHTTW